MTIFLWRVRARLASGVAGLLLAVLPAIAFAQSEPMSPHSGEQALSAIGSTILMLYMVAILISLIVFLMTSVKGTADEVDAGTINSKLGVLVFGWFLVAGLMFLSGIPITNPIDQGVNLASALWTWFVAHFLPISIAVGTLVVVKRVRLPG